MGRSRSRRRIPPSPEHPPEVEVEVEIEDGAGADSEDEERQNRFVHLLKPIRDLATNWNVDIANDLEHYLGELEALHGVDHKLNFAEAALLLQGSAGVYSRKVEYLYRLLFDAYPDAAAQCLASSITEDGVDNDALVPAETKFLLLEIPAIDPKKIAIGENDEIEAQEPRSKRRNSFHQRAAESESAFNLSICSVRSGGAALMLSCDGDDNADSGDIGIGGSFLNSSVMSVSALLNASMLARPKDNRFGSPAAVRAASSPGICFAAEFMEDDDEDDGLADDLPMEDYGRGEFDNHDQEQQNVEMNAANQDEDVHEEVGEVEGSEGDLWAMLDPHQADIGLRCSKKFRRGKTSRVPAKPVPVDAAVVDFGNRYNALITSIHSGSLKAPFFIEFADLFWRQIDRLKKARRGRRKEEAAAARKNLELEPDRALDQAALEDDVQNVDYDDDDDDDDIDCGIGALDLPQDQDHLEFVGDDELDEAPAAGPSIEEVGGDRDPYEILCRSLLDDHRQCTKTFKRNSELAQRVEVWRSRIEPKLDQEEVRTAFDIREYGRNMMEQIESEVGARENRRDEGSEHDRHDDEHVIEFSSAVRGKEQFDICRFFLATLQLANNGNVAISQSDEGDMMLRLLHKDCRFKAMQKNLDSAPSSANSTRAPT